MSVNFLEKKLFFTHRDTVFFNSYRAAFALILLYFAFILPFYFPFFSFYFRFLPFFPHSSFFFKICHIFLFPFLYSFPQKTLADTPPPPQEGRVFSNM
jgi:hypothetical protein